MSCSKGHAQVEIESKQSSIFTSKSKQPFYFLSNYRGLNLKILKKVDSSKATKPKWRYNFRLGFIEFVHEKY